MHSVVQAVTDRIIERSKDTRKKYLEALNDANAKGVHRSALSCGNLAHGLLLVSLQIKNHYVNLLKLTLVLLQHLMTCCRLISHMKIIQIS